MTKTESIQALYLRLLKSRYITPEMTTHKVATILAKQGAPRFFISLKVAVRYIWQYENNLFPANTEKIKLRMVRDLYEVYLRKAAVYTDLPKCQQIQKAIDSPAPSHYTTVRTITNILLNTPI